MSGLKINYQKSEVFGVGINADEQTTIGNLINCEVGVFLLKYLGVPVGPDNTLVKDLIFVALKLDKN